MMKLRQLDKFKLPLAGQQIELQQVDYEGGGMSQLRILIRQHTRFTTVDVDPITAKYWGVALCEWAKKHTPSPATGTIDAASDAVVGDAARSDE